MRVDRREFALLNKDLIQSAAPDPDYYFGSPFKRSLHLFLINFIFIKCPGVANATRAICVGSLSECTLHPDP